MHEILFPSPFGTPPSPELVARARLAPVPAGFTGRAGVLVFEDEAGVHAEHAFEPVSRALCGAGGEGRDWSTLRAAALWPGMSRDEVPERTLVDGRGVRFTVRDFLKAMFEPYPDLPEMQGGRELEARKAGWRMAVTDALTSPVVALVAARNEAAVRGRISGNARIIGLAEWWCGPTPAHEIRFDGTFYPPRAAAKWLYERLVEGLPAAPVSAIASEEDFETLPVLYFDDDIVVIDKPTRLASVPGVRETTSAKEILEKQFGPLRIVHRLDMDTSGVLLFARSLRAEKALHESFREGLAMKRYVARLEGVPEQMSGRIELPLALNRLDRPRQCVLSEAEGGKPAATDWELLRVETMPDGRRKALVSLWPETGRTHQLRVHCAHAAGIGLPIDGDSFYGSRGILAEAKTSRLCLHAAELTIPHPTTGIPVHFEAAEAFPKF